MEGNIIKKNLMEGTIIMELPDRRDHNHGKT
jgi:hypothetical protein